ncbi:hypothetical protein DFH27DRAFT_96443 [Peziza echinospora]|nr:hypothetical protein DFH27DRAFT_96443 [Peziza echinospora]
MHFTTAIKVIGALLAISPVTASITPHTSASRKHIHHQTKRDLTKRGKCQFPSDAGLVPVTPNLQNAGWAMSPDQPCNPGMYCPYACPPGQLMAQWDPSATSYSYPGSMNGGLYCNSNGEIEKPFPNKPYCYDGAGTYKVRNEAGSSVAICQTVLPGNEAMLIPTLVTGEVTLAVPDTQYWCKTAAHYYVNPPGVSVPDGCIWGDKSKPHGNWAPYVAGANQVDSGETFVTVGWNPIYIEPDVPFRDVVPDYGIRVECSGSCNGLPCEIDPSKHKVNELSQKNPPGAGGANFCVVSVAKGSSATLVIFKKDGKSGGGEDSPKEDPKTTTTKKAEPTTVASSTKTTASPQTKTTSTKSASKATATAKSKNEVKIQNVKVDEKEEEEADEIDVEVDQTTTKSALPTYTTSPKGNNRLGGILANNNTILPDEVEPTAEGDKKNGSPQKVILSGAAIIFSTLLGFTLVAI